MYYWPAIFALIVFSIHHRLGKVRIKEKREAPLKTKSIKIENYRSKGIFLSEILQLNGNFFILNSLNVGREQKVMIKGVNSQQTKLFFDGIPLSTPFGEGNDLSIFSLLQANTVDIVSGVNSSVTDVPTIGGGINFIPVGKDESSGMQFNFQTGSFGTLQLKTRVVKQIDNKKRFYLFVSKFKTDGDFKFIDINGNLRTRINNFSDLQGIGGGFLYGNKVCDSSFHLFTTSSFRGMPGLEQFQSKRAFQKSDKYFVYQKFNLKKIMLFLKAFFTAHDYHYKNPDGFLTKNIDNKNRSIQGGISFTKFFVLKRWAYLKTKYFFRAERGTLHQNGELKIKKIRLLSYLEGDLLFHFSKIVKMEGGGTVFKEGTGSSDKFYALPHLKLELFKNPALVFSFKRGFRLPDFYELFFDFEYIKGNEKLLPENSWNFDFEIGFKNSFFVSRTNFYFQKIQNLIMFLPKTPYLIQASNIEGAKVYGFNSNATLLLSEHLKLITGYRFERAVDVASGLEIPFKPRHILNGGLTVLFSMFELNLHIYYQSSFFTDKFNNFSEEARPIVNTFLSYSYKGMKFTFIVRNLLNKMDASDYFMNPLPGRAFYFNFNYNFKGGAL